MWYFDLRLHIICKYYLERIASRDFQENLFRCFYISKSKTHQQFIFFFLKKETATKKTGPSVAAEGIYFSYLETSSTSLGQTAVYESSTLVIRK